MKKKIFRIMGILAVIAVISLLVDSMFGVKTFHDVITMAVPGATIIDSTPTTSTTDTGAPDLQLEHLDEEITKIDPSRFPLDTILRKVARSRKVGSQTTTYYSRDYKPFTDTVTTAIVAADQEYFDVIVSNIKMWSLRDTLRVKGVQGYGANNVLLPNNDLVLYTAEIDKANSTLKCQPLNGYDVAGVKVLHDNIAQDNVITRLARAESELAMQTTSYALYPEKSTNYCQNYMAQIEESTFSAMTDKKTAWGFSDFEEANIKDMKSQKELNALMGAPAEFADYHTQEKIYSAGGATYFVPKTLEWADTNFDTDAHANAWFVALTKYIFQGNSGAQIRYAFFGADLIEKINAVPIVQKQLGANNVSVKWGLTFNEIVTNFGTLRVIKHDLLSEVGDGDMGFVFDLTKVEYHKFQELKETELDLIGSGQKNAKAKVIQEVSCAVFKYPDTHCVIRKTVV